MERGWVWTLMGAHSELWPPRCFSQHPNLVHISLGLLSTFPGEAARYLPSVGTRSYVGSRILPPSPCDNPTSSGSHSENGVPRSLMKAPQGSYFAVDSQSSSVTVTGPLGHHMPNNLLLLRGRMSPQVPLSHTWR